MYVLVPNQGPAYVGMLYVVHLLLGLQPMQGGWVCKKVHSLIGNDQMWVKTGLKRG